VTGSALDRSMLLVDERQCALQRRPGRHLEGLFHLVALAGAQRRFVTLCTRHALTFGVMATQTILRRSNRDARMLRRGAVAARTRNPVVLGVPKRAVTRPFLGQRWNNSACARMSVVARRRCNQDQEQREHALA
jgi:hypothetical protein